MVREELAVVLEDRTPKAFPVSLDIWVCGYIQ
jgi:hypothetical protein